MRLLQVQGPRQVRLPTAQEQRPKQEAWTRREGREGSSRRSCKLGTAAEEAEEEDQEDGPDSREGWV